MTKILCGAAWLLLSAAAQAAAPVSVPDGKRLHDTHCTGCHDTAVYTRQNRSIKSLQGLRQQLAGCAHMAQQNFSPAESQSLIDYLNEHFYHFR